ncbi:MAG TPA: Uma2 family endonuclease [Oculatellaceae cyanobacterium]|jgi:Uma2 family endonuclease
MIVSHKFPYISAADYLEGEKVSLIKHEYRNGYIYAMAGTSDAHDTVALNLLTLLRNHVRGTGCRTYTGNMKVNIDSANTYYYPDAMVTCDQRDREFDYFKRYPCLIVEVLSPSTQAFDRSDKFADYAQLESLQEYVLISQDQIKVECFRRNSEGGWDAYTYTQGQEVNLASINFQCDITALYEDVLF